MGPATRPQTATTKSTGSKRCIAFCKANPRTRPSITTTGARPQFMPRGHRPIGGLTAGCRAAFRPEDITEKLPHNLSRSSLLVRRGGLRVRFQPTPGCHIKALSNAGNPAAMTTKSLVAVCKPVPIKPKADRGQAAELHQAVRGYRRPAVWKKAQGSGHFPQVRRDAAQEYACKVVG